jgi:hypothetical protein
MACNEWLALEEQMVSRQISLKFKGTRVLLQIAIWKLFEHHV